jgi:DNA-binding transcriptional regulator YhcF (GntR family)
MNLYSVAYKTIQKLNIRSSAILVFYDLCRMANKENECWPSKQTIAKACHISVSTVTRSLRELEKAGMIVTVCRFRDNNRQTSNCYKVFETPQNFTQHTQNSYTENIPEQQNISESIEDNVPAACEKATHNSPDIIVSETTICNEKHEQIRHIKYGKGKENKPVNVEQSTYLKSQTDYKSFSTFQLLLCFIKANFDTLAHVNVTPQGTISRTKVTYNLRNKSIFSKLTEWYRGKKQKKDAGSNFCPAPNE